MKFVAAEGKHPLQNLDMIEHYSFPRELLRVGFLYNYWYGHMLHTEVIYIYIYIYKRLSLSCAQTLVEHLLSMKEDMSLLISRFQEFLEMDDVRYYVMSSVRDNIYRVMGRNKKVSVVVYIASFSAYLFCIINYTSLFFFF